MRTTISYFVSILFILGMSTALKSQAYISKTYGLGYSAGEGQGGSFIFERKLENSTGAIGDFGIGALVNIRGQEIEQGDRTEIILATRLSYHPHFIKHPKLDIYGFAALGVGFDDINNDRSYMGPREEAQTQFTAWGLGAGVHYQIYKSIGVFAEGSYGVGAVTVGLAWRVD